MQYKDFWFANGSEAGPLTYQSDPQNFKKRRIFVGRKNAKNLQMISFKFWWKQLLCSTYIFW